ncbi:MAG TPA: CbiX/SirB N-terminal domain-containing protein [Ornithinimicrobium sp.]|uniref:sirohydrochlorin chelatase n=1 Tax=Ornithinimicrobium sp. TaxID=1977084 RepID=UPI002B4776D8|nr:CbiX/SirB N-terminal domain-containing protein [Ornithinimicrobium sp.]HKJ10847.1 CbiX/SirB N-terminal domain-containing protein [Ornithinimicrobium sp.]
MSTPRPLVLLAHGTANPAGRETVYAVSRLVARRLPKVDLTVGFVDVCSPGPEVVLPPHPDAVVVPYLLTSGYHVHHDIPEAIARYAPDAVQTPALGLAGQVIDVAARRHRESLPPARAQVDAAVLTGAGSSDPRARQEVLCSASVLAACLALPVRAGFLSGPGPRGAEVVQDLRREGAACVAAISFLLAPGFFHGKAKQIGADVVSAPLGVHAGLADLVVARYRRGCVGPSPSSDASSASDAGRGEGKLSGRY